MAISNDRLLDLTGAQVRFTYKDYRAKAAPRRVMSLAADEFIRRFLLHVLPPGFHRIRYFGFLGARHRRTKLVQCQLLLGSTMPITPPGPTASPTDYRDRTEALTGISLRTCPACHQGRMIIVEPLLPTSVLITDTS